MLQKKQRLKSLLCFGGQVSKQEIENGLIDQGFKISENGLIDQDLKISHNRMSGRR